MRALSYTCLGVVLLVSPFCFRYGEQKERQYIRILLFAFLFLFFPYIRRGSSNTRLLS